MEKSRFRFPEKGGVGHFWGRRKRLFMQQKRDGNDFHTKANTV
jgi:hypothetical protein